MFHTVKVERAGTVRCQMIVIRGSEGKGDRGRRGLEMARNEEKAQYSHLQSEYLLLIVM